MNNTETKTQTHSIWNFLSDQTICGAPIQYKRVSLPDGDTMILENVVLELEDITCPECKEKATHART